MKTLRDRPLLATALVGAVAVLAAGWSLQPVDAAGTAPAPTPAARPAGPGRPDHTAGDAFPGVRELQRMQQRRRAVEALADGAGRLVGHGRDRVIELRGADGPSRVEYSTRTTAHVLTFLTEFGDADPIPENPSGPLHNQIARPVADDPWTIWRPDFGRGYYERLMFDGLRQQRGESFRDYYRQASSGRFLATGDVTDWVQVPGTESSYDDGRSATTGGGVSVLAGDTGAAWYENELARGRSPEQIDAYLAQFDVQDRFDADGDGDFTEPDGYLDYVQIVHAGEAEENTGIEWAIATRQQTAWTSDGVTSNYGVTGPDPSQCEACGRYGGQQVGDSHYYIDAFTIQGENTGLGIFAHEFGHLLGLPDLYDVTQHDQAAYVDHVNVWSLMGYGSALSHGTVTATTPGLVGPWEKLLMGWYRPDALATIDYAHGESGAVRLGPAFHATRRGRQAALVTLPEGRLRRSTGITGEDDQYLYSGAKDSSLAWAASAAVTVPPDAELTARVSYDIETDHDYAYLAAFDPDTDQVIGFLPTSRSTDANPNGANLGGGITGDSGGAWVDLTADLSSLAGQRVKVGWAYVTDHAVHGVGFAVDQAAVDGTALKGWTTGDAGFYLTHGDRYSVRFTRFYLAENRTFDGYDTTLGEGWAIRLGATGPDSVDFFGAEEGLLVWYYNGLYSSTYYHGQGGNNVSQHPGDRLIGPVDAHPDALPLQRYTDLYPWVFTPGQSWNQLNTRDAPFSTRPTSPLRVHIVDPNDGRLIPVRVPSLPAVPAFQDCRRGSYFDPANPTGSPRTAGSSVRIAIARENVERRTMRIVIDRALCG